MSNDEMSKNLFMILSERPSVDIVVEMALEPRYVDHPHSLETIAAVVVAMVIKPIAKITIMCDITK